MENWNYNAFWLEAIKEIQRDFTEQSKGQEFSIWFTALEYESSEELGIHIAVPSAFYRDQMKIRGYTDIIQNKLCELSGQKIQVSFVIKSKSPAKTKAAPVKETHAQPEFQQPVQMSGLQTEKAGIAAENTAPFAATADISREPVLRTDTSFPRHPQLRSDYTFDSFVRGENAFAYNAAFAVANNPGHAYNPLLIYGGVGLGKTHLMQSIGNFAYAKSQETNTKLNIIYITAETFTNEFIQSIHSDSQTKFKSKYRSADILLIDDIHFFQNKDGTQEELFHTFNALYDSFKQIVFTCDRPISELKNLTERLRSRFERGLNVDLQVPQYETRRAILERKLKQNQKYINSEVIDLIAQNVVTNVRDLEASLTKIIAYTELIGQEVTVEIARQQLRDTFTSPKAGNITIDSIQKVVADYYNISFADIKGKKRTKNVLFPRQLAMYIARQLTEFSLTELGAEFGGKDHTTVMHSIDKVDAALKSDTLLEKTIQTLIRAVKDYKK